MNTRPAPWGDGPGVVRGPRSGSAPRDVVRDPVSKSLGLDDRVLGGAQRGAVGGAMKPLASLALLFT
jgi:hypothetical protein